MMLEILLSSALRVLLLWAVVWLSLHLARVRNPHAEALAWRMVIVAALALPALLYWRLAPNFEMSLALPVITVTDVGGGYVRSVLPPAPSLVVLVAVTIYLGVAVLLSVRLVSSLATMWHVIRAAQPMTTPDDVRISARMRSPATFGNTILLPTDAPAWPADRLAAVLAHERAHVRARDGFWSWLAQLHVAIFWFNPLAWWMQRRLEMLAETTSDDAVVAARHDPVAYAALLLDFARHPNSRSVAMSVAESNVPERIERLLALTPPAAALPRVARWAAFAALIPAVVLAASTTRAAPPAESAAPTAAPRSAPGSAPATPRLTAGVRITHTADPDDYYPAVAKHEKVTGYAIVEVDVDVLGQLVDARVVKVQPAEPRFGFADAALQVARSTTFGNPGQQVASMRFMVKFDLQE